MMWRFAALRRYCSTCLTCPWRSRSCYFRTFQVARPCSTVQVSGGGKELIALAPSCHEDHGCCSTRAIAFSVEWLMLLALSQHTRCFQLCCAPIALVCLLAEKKEMSADLSTCAKMQADVSTCEYRQATDDHKKAKKKNSRAQQQSDTCPNGHE